MSAHLSETVGYEFQRAYSKDHIFGRDDHNDLSLYEQRETAPICSLRASCDTNQFVDFFFDGTVNNYLAAEETRDHSNIARRYDCLPSMSVPGVLRKSTDCDLPNRFRRRSCC